MSTSICFLFVSLLINSSYAQTVDNFKNYSDDDMNFSIQYPSNWEVSDLEPSFPVVYIWGDRDTREVDWHKLGFEIYTHKIQPYLDTDTMTLKNTSLQQRVQEELNDISQSNDTNLIRQNEVTVGGNNGWKVEYRTIDKNNDRYGFVIYTIADGKFYVLRYFEDSLKVPETLPLVNKMVDSFQIKTENEDSSNGLTFEEYRKKYCPEYSNETQLLVLCSPSELEESEDVPVPPPQD